MDNRKKTVLLFQPSKFQAEVWQFILAEYSIFVVWEENYTNRKQIDNYFKKPGLRPDLLIIDLKVKDAYELCRWCKEKYPEAKLILTTDLKSGYSEAIRRWAVNQGVDELLINFPKKDLSSGVLTNINAILRVLNYPPANPQNLVKALDAWEYKNIDKTKGEITLVSQDIPNQNVAIATTKAKYPVLGYSLGVFVTILLIITIVLDVSMLWLIAPVQEIQRQVLVHIREQKDDNRTEEGETLQKIESVPKGTFSYGGSTTWAPIRKIVNPQISKEYPEFNLRYVQPINATPGSGTGIRMLLDGELDFSQSSRSIERQEHISAHQQGFSLREYHVAIDAIAIVVNPSLKVPGLTIEQLKKIYSGEITNWQEVNGPDLEIVPFSRKAEDGGTPEFFQDHVLQNQPFGSKIEYVYSTTDGLNQVKNTLGGIYYASAPEIVPQCTVKSIAIANQEGEFIPPYLPPAVPLKNCPNKRNQLNSVAIKNATYPLTRYLYVIVKQDDGRAQKAGEAFAKLMLTKEMQTLIKKVGFVPVN